MNDVQSQRPVLCERLYVRKDYYNEKTNQIGGFHASGTDNLSALPNGYFRSFFDSVSEDDLPELIKRTTNVSFGIIIRLNFFTGSDSTKDRWLDSPSYYRPRVLCILTLDELKTLGPDIFKNCVDDHLQTAGRVCKIIRNDKGVVQHILMKESILDGGRCTPLAAIGECSFLPHTPAASDLDEDHPLRNKETWLDHFKTGLKVTSLVQTAKANLTSEGYPDSRIVVGLNDDDYSKLPVQLRAERDRIYTELTAPPPPPKETTSLIGTAERTNSFGCCVLL